MEIMYNEKTASSENSSIFGGDSSVIIWIILGVLISLLVIYFIYSWIKDKINKKKTRQAAIQLEKNAAIYWYETTLKINELIRLNRIQHENFVVSIGEFKMSEINNAASDTINDLMNEYEFKNYLLSNEKYSTYVSNIKVLKDLNLNLWDKKLSNSSLKFFEDELPKSEKAAREAISTELSDLKSTSELYDEIKAKYNEKLDKKVNNEGQNEQI
ncbi:Uncharacterised protein [Mycoplasmopsis canis]|uniref:Uncharacterized protein n=1 Tax=Mycoplasmopsis canis TaxID=29555 RepID=A0A449AR12_9BACT|nr:hypothetical protein [Mycoplasmopsis canis]VEU68920.1 Uncharacterised protein [Mycoplasmopsis canis]